MKMLKLIPAILVAILIHISLPAMAEESQMKTDVKMTSEKETMMTEKPMMTSDTMEKKTMMAPSKTAMLDGVDDHHAAGTVKFAHEMGHNLLVLSGIKIDKVPDGHVYLAKQGNRKTGVDLGVLKQFSGDVSFKLPQGTDPDAYDSVVIYCEKFNVEIGRAEFKKSM